MAPKRKAQVGTTPAAAGNSKKMYGKAPELPDGELLTDFAKKQWRLGRTIGSGGFGRIYLATKADEKTAQYVVKMEPATNGPLFQEIHFYQRVGKAETLQQWRKDKGLKFLGIPQFIAAGKHAKNSVEFRFLIMPRFGMDLEKYRESCDGGRLEPSFVFRLAECCLDALEYLHYSAQYVHADVKGENLLAAGFGSGKGGGGGVGSGDQFYLVDYGLARKVADNPVYKEDPKKAGDGTMVFTSLDAHRGCVPSYRGDVEILGYNLIFWITGTLPWMKASEAQVFESKLNLSKNVRAEIGRIPMLAPFSTELVKFFEYAYGLEYADRPDFDHLRQLTHRLSTKAKPGRRSESSSAASPAARARATVASPATKKAKAAASSSTPPASSSPKTKGRVGSTSRSSPAVAAAAAAAKSPSRSSRRFQSPLAKQNGVSTSKKTPLLRKFEASDDEDDEDDEDEDESDEEPAKSTNGASSSISTKKLTRQPIRRKMILADDTPSPSPVRAKPSPRSIIPGKVNLRRYDPGAAAKRRSSIMVKKKYLGSTTATANPKTTTVLAKVQAHINVSTAPAVRSTRTKKSYRISSSTEDDD